MLFHLLKVCIVTYGKTDCGRLFQSGKLFYHLHVGVVVP